MNKPIVVGIEGSTYDEQLLSWSVAAAQRHQAPLVVVHSAEISPEVLLVLQARGEAPDVAERAVDRLASDHPGLSITAEAAVGSPAQALLDHQDQAGMIVVGMGRADGLQRLFLGSTTLPVVAHGRCPVAVIPPGLADRPTRGVVALAVDGSHDSSAAAETAFAEAALLGARLECVIVWSIEVVNGYVVTEPDSPEWLQIEADRRGRVEAAIADARAAFPDVEVTISVEHGSPGAVLADRTAEVDLLVMGSRGRGGFVGRLLGSVSQRVIQAAAGPVIVVTAR